MMSCNLCGSDSVYLLFNLPYGYSITKCRICGLWSLYPKPSKETLYKIYKDNYFESWGVTNRDSKSLKNLKELLYKTILRQAEKYIYPGNLLDVGCAFGHSFNLAIRMGWNPFGVELSPEAYEIASEQFPSRISLGDFSDIKLADNCFNLVILSDLLEHLNSLIEPMMKVHRILRHKGLVAIITPDNDSFSARFMGRFWPHIKVEHLYYLSKKSLKILFGKTGFKPLLFKNIWKPINLIYLTNQIETYKLDYWFLSPKLLKLINVIFPNHIKRFNIRIPQGEIFALAEKL